MAAVEAELFPRPCTAPSIAAPSGSKARMFEPMDGQVRAGPLGARSAGKFRQHDVAETVVPGAVVLVLRFPHESASQINGLAGTLRAWRSLEGVEAIKDRRPMRATQVLQKCLSVSLEPMHRARLRVLMLAMEALIAGRRLTMMDMARSWPGAERIRAPLKAIDRLLGNSHLQGERERIYANMARWLLRGPQPVIVIDWSSLKPDVSWCLLRAAVPIGGRTLPILDMVCPGALQGSPIAERHFLERLRKLIPKGVTPILITDAGFRTPWFMAVNAMGWHWIGRLRGRTLCKPQTLADGPKHWVHARDLFARAGSTAHELPPMHVHQRKRLACRCVLFKKPAKGRKHWNHRQPSKVSHHSESRKAARREREPWLLLASPALKLDACQLVQLYARRMQIELSFRDLKSHRYGQGFEDSLTRTGKRIEALLLIHALAAFASWLAGLVCEATGVARWLTPISTSRKLYSTLRTGREALLRGWPLDRASRWLKRLRCLPLNVLEQMQATM